MEDTPGKEHESVSDTDSVYKDSKETRDLSVLGNGSFVKTSKCGEYTDDIELDEHKEMLPGSSYYEVHDLRFFESMKDRCGGCENSEINESDRKRITLDALMISPPKINHSSSQDENSGPIEPGGGSVMLNTKALTKEAKTYELEKFEKNCLIIFNQESIDGFEPRLGTEKDVKALTETFKNYGFDVVEHKDFTKDQIVEVLETFKTTNFTEYGCVGVVVLTHGSFNGLLRAKDQAYSETDIIKYFKVYDKPTLITKPKLLIVQACRGTRCLPGVMVQRTGNLRKDADDEVEPYTLPVMSDMLIVHSSYIGEASTRDELHGSWFIQTLCSKINEMASLHDLESILTEVKREVAADRQWEDYNRSTREMDIYKQMPTVTSTLIRKLYLRKFGDESPPISFLDSLKPESSMKPVLDTAITPMLCQLGPCSCFLDHFDYIKKCLTYFLDENPSDATARTFLDISNAFENEDQFNAAKERMAKAICEHLSQHARHCEFFKYLYFYKH